jgi:antitoxin PrlF
VPSATLTSKGQLTLPKPIRELLRVGAGDRVDFVVGDDGTIVLRAATVDVRDLKGLLYRKGIKRASIAEMNAAIRRRAAARR